ncbi:MAG: hypothetical protein U0237_07580 [Thermoleophilia bacterium]
MPVLSGTLAACLLCLLSTWLPEFTSSFDNETYSLWELRELDGSPLSNLHYWLLGFGAAGAAASGAGLATAALGRRFLAAVCGALAPLAGIALASVPIRAFVEYRDIQDQADGDSGIGLGVGFFVQIAGASAVIVLGCLLAAYGIQLRKRQITTGS